LLSALPRFLGFPLRISDLWFQHLDSRRQARSFAKTYSRAIATIQSKIYASAVRILVRETGLNDAKALKKHLEGKICSPLLNAISLLFEDSKDVRQKFLDCFSSVNHSIRALPSADCKGRSKKQPLKKSFL
jgi:hypothetical protein